jgi:hypothetical protein
VSLHPDPVTNVFFFYGGSIQFNLIEATSTIRRHADGHGRHPRSTPPRRRYASTVHCTGHVREAASVRTLQNPDRRQQGNSIVYPLMSHAPHLLLTIRRWTRRCGTVEHVDDPGTAASDTSTDAQLATACTSVPVHSGMRPRSRPP